MMRTGALLLGILLGLAFSMGSAQANADLIAAAREGNLEAAVKAIESSSDGPEALSRPLFFAAQRGHAEVVKLLLERGADANISFTFGSPLHAAARANDTAVVALMLDHGADPDLEAGDFNHSPLHEAADRGAFEAATMLIQRGADVNFRNSKGRPAIHVAAKAGDWEMVEFLRSKGAVPNLPEPIMRGELDEADLEAGLRALYGCNICHEIAEGKTATGTHVGPSLIGIFEAPRAARDNFAYSNAMAELDGFWTAEALNIFLSDPTGVVPGTEMLRVPEMTREERIGLIAVLRSAAK